MSLTFSDGFNHTHNPFFELQHRRVYGGRKVSVRPCFRTPHEHLFAEIVARHDYRLRNPECRTAVKDDSSAGSSTNRMVHGATFTPNSRLILKATSNSAAA